MEFILLGHDKEFNVPWKVKIGESGTKKIFSESNKDMCGSLSSFINLDFFPILHFIGQTPDIGCQTKGRV